MIVSFRGPGNIVATIKVLLADDNEAMLSDLQDELGKEFVVVGAVSNGEEAIKEAVRLDPDILVLDITMAGMNGLQVASHLRELHPRTKILFLSIHEEPEYVAAAFSAGACGYVTKRRLARDLTSAIRDVYEGKRFVSPSLQK
jgi:DNA-binding NarL/FixJ family response regulator